MSVSYIPATVKLFQTASRSWRFSLAITMITSVALLIASFIMFIFYFWLIVLRCIKHSDVDFAYCESLRWATGVMLLIASFLLSLCIFQSAKGNKNEKNILSRWINRDELQAGIKFKICWRFQCGKQKSSRNKNREQSRIKFQNIKSLLIP